jgi:DNA sulfur modification protein DndE
MSALNKIYISENTDRELRTLKGRTGLTPNLLIRIGLVYSLEEDGLADLKLYGEDHYREFNRYTLLGQWDLFFMSLLKERMNRDGFDLEEDLENQFKAHLSRGVHLVYQRLKSLEDLAPMIEHLEKKKMLRSKSLDETIDELVDE